MRTTSHNLDLFFKNFLAGSFTRMRWIGSDDVQLEEKGSRQQSRHNKYGNKVSPGCESSTENSYISQGLCSSDQATILSNPNNFADLIPNNADSKHCLNDIVKPPE